MITNPLAQFNIKNILVLKLADVDVSFTNSSCFMLIAVLLIIFYFSFALREKSEIPSRLQISAELIYNFIFKILDQNIGKQQSHKFTSFIFSLFMFILICNLLGMFPYGFTVCSHISITFTLAFFIFILVTIIGFVKNGLCFFKLFLPEGTPIWLAPIMIIIELFTYLAYPISLSLRLSANMIAGHVLLKIIASFIIYSVFFLKFVPLILTIILVGFEIFISILQAYIFTVLSCVYLGNVINLHTEKR